MIDLQLKFLKKREKRARKEKSMRKRERRRKREKRTRKVKSMEKKKEGRVNHIGKEKGMREKNTGIRKERKKLIVLFT